jgi:release factor glutamine methyltransferase
MEIYTPKEDSFFLAKQLEKFLKTKDKNIKVLDMGTGSGILAETALKSGIHKKNILAVDINPEAVKKLTARGIKSIHSDLFSEVKKKFDLVVFNPPYLPQHRYDKEKDTTGGKKGDETIIRFLKQVNKYLKKDGAVLLLLSSLTPRKKIDKELQEQNLKKRKLAEKKLFFEKLEVWLLQP